jgi:hypothetical protein
MRRNYTFPIGPLPHEISPAKRPVPYGAWGVSAAEIDAAIQFGPVPEDDPARQAAGAGAGAAMGAIAGLAAGPIGAIVGALAGAAPQVVGLVQGIQARRGTLAGLFKKAAALKVKLAKAKKAGRRANLLTKYRATVQAIAAEQQNIAMLEAQAAQQNLPVPPPAPPYALYAVAGVGLVAVIGGLVYLVRRKR